MQMPLFDERGLLNTASGPLSNALQNYVNWWKTGPLGGMIAGTPPEQREPWNVPALAMGFVGPGAIKSVGGAPLAMDLASRLARAGDQGYNIKAYKGMYPYDPNTVPITNFYGKVIEGADRIPKEVTSFNSPNKPYSGFFTDDPAVANRFSAAFDEGAGYHALLNIKNPLTIDMQGKPAAAFQWESLAKEHGTLGQYKAFQEALSNKKYDGVIIKNTKDEGTIYIPRDSWQARLYTAAFDPKKKHDPDMLSAGIPPIMAGAIPQGTNNE